MKLELHTMNGLGKVVSLSPPTSIKILTGSVRPVLKTAPILDVAVIDAPVKREVIKTPVVNNVVSKSSEISYTKPVIDAPAIVTKPTENIMSNINTSPLTKLPVSIPNTLPVVKPVVNPAPPQVKPSFIENLNKTVTSVADTVQKVTATTAQVKQVFNSNQQTVSQQAQQNNNNQPPARQEKEGMSTGLKIGLAVGGMLLFGGAVIAIRNKKNKKRSGMGRLPRKAKKSTKRRSASRPSVKRKTTSKKVKRTAKRRK
jgi:hypothetical protein